MDCVDEAGGGRGGQCPPEEAQGRRQEWHLWVGDDDDCLGTVVMRQKWVFRENWVVDVDVVLVERRYAMSAVWWR